MLLLDELNENRPWDNYTFDPVGRLGTLDHCDTPKILQNFRRSLSIEFLFASTTVDFREGSNNAMRHRPLQY
jgi:hypothetical protein